MPPRVTVQLHLLLILLLILWTQLLAQLDSYDWWEATLPMRAEWRSAWTICGVLCVMTPGEPLKLLWCVDSWDTPLKVSNRHPLKFLLMTTIL